jgi:hypothetical protein
MQVRPERLIRSRRVCSSFVRGNDEEDGCFGERKRVET